VWNSLDLTATVCLRDCDIGTQLESSDLLSAWEVYEALARKQVSEDQKAHPAARLKGAEIKRIATYSQTGFPLLAEYSSYAYDDESGRGVDVSIGVLHRADEGAIDHAAETGASWLVVFEPRPLIDLFPVSVLFAACARGKEPMLERALAAGADPRTSLYVGNGGLWVTVRHSALVTAAAAGHTHLIPRLLDAGANPDHLEELKPGALEKVKADPASVAALEQRGVVLN
jgi:hypothetical protein